MPEVFTLLVEEVGEFAKAIRENNGQKFGAHSKHREVAEEAADIFWLLIALFNRPKIDLAAAYRDKESNNHKQEGK